MELRLVERADKQFLEGPAGEPLLREVAEVVSLVEACFNQRANRRLLQAENLTDRFFDLSSRARHLPRELRGVRGAGQGSRRNSAKTAISSGNDHIRLAVVWSPEVRQLSHRFGDLMVEEDRNRYFRLFAEQPKAEAWLLEG